MRHTIVVEVPEQADPSEAEEKLSRAVRRVFFNRVQGKYLVNDFCDVVEYHREQMTASVDSRALTERWKADNPSVYGPGSNVVVPVDDDSR